MLRLKRVGEIVIMTDDEIEKAFYMLGQLEGFIGYLLIDSKTQENQKMPLKNILITIEKFMHNGAKAIRILRDEQI